MTYEYAPDKVMMTVFVNRYDPDRSRTNIVIGAINNADNKYS